MQLSLEQIINLAPNPATAKRAQSLATISKWEKLNSNDRAIWGECKGSGSKNYQCSIDTKGPAFKCNCPSRIFPCKHSLGLYFLFIQKTDEFQTNTNPPNWLVEWLEKRDTKQSNDSTVPDLKTSDEVQKSNQRKLKTYEKRLVKMTDGMNDLEVWLSDLVRQGLANTEGQDYQYWNDIASRMVDSQLKSIGVRIREMQLLQGANTDWPEAMLQEVADIYLLTQGFKNLETLPTPLQSQILSIVGVTTKRAELELEDGIIDIWTVIGLLEGVNIDNGKYRKVWLIGQQTNRLALILDFDYRNMGYETIWGLGQHFSGELVYYKASYPTRAILKNRELIKDADNNTLIGFKSLKDFASSYANALSLNPWLSAFPSYLESVIPLLKKDKLFIIDQDKKKVVAIHKENLAWKLMAISGNQPINIFGEWTGNTLLPLSVITQNRIIKL